MHVITGFCIIILVIATAILASFLFQNPNFSEKNQVQDQNLLIPFSMILISDNRPATKAFLEYYASQIAWMDSSILRCMLLVYPDDNPDAEQLCEDMSRQHEFFTACSVSAFYALLDKPEKNPEIF